MWQKKQIVLTAFLNFPNKKFHEQNFSFHFFTPYLLWMNWRDLFSFIMKCFLDKKLPFSSYKNYHIIFILHN